MENINMKLNNKYLIFVALAILLSLLTSCSVHKFIDKSYMYDSDQIIGKSSDEIQDRYGNFDFIDAKFNEDGSYCDGWCGYLTANGINDIDFYMLIAPIYDEYYLIHFDEDGVADKIEKRANIKGY